ncbi:MAG TPA: hypothetical protein PK863_01240 [Candidatus Dojkabacteria bacterium]|nr:hypothetical protein [Candidatus Dojkabacteria bacterium]HRP50913.1 hypothetical protein [Candidatus Dojkabacteria bacterium]
MDKDVEFSIPSSTEGNIDGVDHKFNLRSVLLKLVPMALMTLALAACMSKNPMPAQSLVVPTPMVTPPTGLIPTPEISPYDDLPLYITTGDTLEHNEADTVDYCKRLKDFQDDQVPESDLLAFTPNAASNLSPDEVQALHAAISDFNLIAPDGCGFGGSMEGPLFVSLTRRDDPDTRLAYVPLASQSCAETAPIVVLSPENIRQMLDPNMDTLEEVMEHELGHTCGDGLALVEKSIKAKPVKTFIVDDYGSPQIVTPSFTDDITTYGKSIFEYDIGLFKSDATMYLIMEEITAEMFLLATEINKSPELKEYQSMHELWGVVGFKYKYDVTNFHETLRLYGYNVPPNELALIFVSNSNTEDPLVRVANAISYYKDPDIDFGVTTFDIITSFAVANSKPSGDNGNVTSEQDQLAEAFFRNTGLSPYEWEMPEITYLSNQR